MEGAAIAAALNESLAAVAGAPPLDAAVAAYVASLAGLLVSGKTFDEGEWNKGLCMYLEQALGKKEARCVVCGVLRLGIWFHTC